MSNYKVILTEQFKKDYKSLIKSDRSLGSKIDTSIHKLISDPFYPGLRTHRVDTKRFGFRFSSRVTGDIRIIWDYSTESNTLIILTISGHEVYK